MNKCSYNLSYMDSSDGIHKTAIYTFDNVENPKAVVQISHGMQEHIGRYENFAEILNKNGFIVVGNDHLGHGKTSNQKTDEGFFAKKNGAKYVLQDLHSTTNFIKQNYKNIPVFLFGHSMGSFFARLFAMTYGNEVKGYIFCGTSGNVKFEHAGLLVLNFLKLIKGKKYYSKLAEKLMLDNYFKYINNIVNKREWITSDQENLTKYLKDDKTQIKFTVGAYYDMLKTLITVNKNSWAKKLDKDLPYLLISGAQDPVGQYGSGVCNVYKMMEKYKVQNIDLKLYAKARHEPHNEVPYIKQNFYEDIIKWLNENLNKLEKNI